MDTKTVQQHGLSSEEYQKILTILGREPNLLELGIFSVMWSEHCSYKSSRVFLKKLPTKGKQVLCGPGENAGIVDIGDGLGLVFKMESHNHPSFIEPFQGAATGVGGILRDVFTMGARPIALLNSLRFGSPNHPKTKYLVKGVVAGIAGYGNCMGIPTVGGEVSFHSSYNGNNLVNAMCVGLVKKNRIFKAKAAGVGNPVFYVGSKTGRDGIHGATMASDVFDEKSEEKRPTVQVGDPFTEKRLMEACLELFQTKDLVGIQDMGAAGLTCSSFEMASKGNVGIDLDLSKVPLREVGMTPYEVMLSESQERMLFVAKKGAEKRVEKIFKKWGLDVSAIGKVVRGSTVRIFNERELVGEIPAHPIAEEAPCYERSREKPSYLGEVNSLSLDSISMPPEMTPVLLRLLSSPNIANKEWVYHQYDHMIGTDTVILPGSDAAVLRIKGTKRSDSLKGDSPRGDSPKGVAMATDCNSTYCYLDPYQGAMHAVAEAARNIVCSGAKPLAVTDCLNFGNPENPGILWQFEQAIRGITEACLFLGTPIVSGNVSFYNESLGQSVYPTPTIGMVGLLEDVKTHCTQWFKEEGDLVFLLGNAEGELGGSEYLSLVHGKVQGTPPPLKLAREKKVQETCLQGIQKGWIRSAHDCSEGGLAVALAECCISGPQLWGVDIKVRANGRSPLRPDLLLFGEAASRIVVTVRENNLQRFLRWARLKKCPVQRLGVVTRGPFRLDPWITVPTAELQKAWKEGFVKCVA
ncbi:MAG: phosphoribosylformylglycinamidine synthase subunit PurL [Deltaproteobacteria bacterium]|nr:phosphoribosylformylglycinamidine synthase subunit PurL [Deltaproteobacteria bacterium]